MKNILFKKGESFSDKDKEIRIHFLYCGEEYMFSYYNINHIKNTLILNEKSSEVIYKNYIDVEKNEKDSEFSAVFDEIFLESLKRTKLKAFFNFDFIDIIRFHDDWN